MLEPQSAFVQPVHRSWPAWLPSSLGTVGLLLRGADLAIVVLAALMAFTLLGDSVDAGPLLGFVVVCGGLMQLDLFRAVGLYRPKSLASLRAQAWRVSLAWSVIPSLLCLLTLALAGEAELPPLLFQAWFASGLAVLLPLHAAVGHWVSSARARGHLTTRIVLVGAGPQAAHFLQHLRRFDPAVQVLGIFDERLTRVPPSVEGCPVLGDLEALAAFAQRHPIDQIVVTLPQSAAARRLACLEKLRSLPVHVRLCPDLPALEVGGRGVSELGGLPLLRVFDRPLAGWQGLVKAIEDRLLAALLLVLLAPLMLLLALLIRLETRGPALYRQQRYGFDNRPISVLKFRTMYHERCDPDGAVTPARRGDPRVTPLGRFLRQTSMDELPQLLNVLKGDMSIVGPRPHATAQNQQFAKLIDGYLARHRVKPGLTGWAQIHGLRGEAQTLAKMQERIRYDLFYIENWSLLLDLRIIVRTFLVGFSHPNAY